MTPPFFNPDSIPPYPAYVTLLDERDKIIQSALLGGHDYDAALRFAKQHVSDDDVQRARDAHKLAMDEWAKRQRPTEERSWLARLFGWRA